MFDLKVETKRTTARDEKRNQGRNLEEPQEEVKENLGSGQRLSRLDRLEQFRREKKTLVPFRAGVYHPSKEISALPPVPRSGRSQPGRRTAMKRTNKPPADRKKAGEQMGSGKKTPRGSQLIQRYKNKISPRASFAPLNFQFSLQLQPPPAQPQEEENEEVPVPAPHECGRHHLP